MNADDKDTGASENLDDLHQKVNNLLDLPLPSETDAWSLRLDTSVSNIPPGHEATGAVRLIESPN
jgi:hypothetical protein